jgi:DNA-binding transcriptional ArsR family regulator
MLKVRLSAADLSRVRFAISPINQIVLYSAQRRYITSIGSPARLSGVRTRESAARLVFELLAAKVGDRPDFLTPPPEQDADFDNELEALRATPASLVADELKNYDIHPELRDLLALAEGDERVKNLIAEGLHHVHRTIFGRDWGDIKSTLRADIARRTAVLGNHGLDHILSRLHSRVSYRDGLLTLHSPRSDPDVIGHGQGLVLVPTIVPSRAITIKVNPRDPIVLIYPVGSYDQPVGSAASAALPAEQRLPPVIGHGRASILLALLGADVLSTSELAQRCGIAISSASEHATVLRKAGLIDSRRKGNRVLHRLTAVGTQLAQGHDTNARLASLIALADPKMSPQDLRQ